MSLSDEVGWRLNVRGAESGMGELRAGGWRRALLSMALAISCVRPPCSSMCAERVGRDVRRDSENAKSARRTEFALSRRRLRLLMQATHEALAGLLDEHSLVTFRYFAQHVGVPVSAAKEALESYAEANDAAATFLVGGTRKGAAGCAQRARRGARPLAWSHAFIDAPPPAEAEPRRAALGPHLQTARRILRARVKPKSSLTD